jgi:drug/metabolite transporter (DMT)-like permease
MYILLHCTLGEAIAEREIDQMELFQPTATPILVHAALLLVSLLFGANYVVAKIALREVSPLGLVVLRTWGTAATLFAASMLWPRKAPRPPLSRADVGHLFFYSLLGASINQVFFLEGLARSTATNASVMQVLIPVLTLAVAVILRRERATLFGVAGIVLGLAGALLLIVPRGGVDMTSRATTGNLLLFVSGSAYASYLVLTRPILARHDPLRVVSWVFLLAGVTVTPIGLRGVRDLVSTGASGAGWASIAFVVIGATALPYLLNSWALVRVKSSIVAIYILLQPIVAGVLGRIFLGDQLAPHTALAAALVLTGVVLSVRRRT